jgi:hypothetical protein
VLSGEIEQPRENAEIRARMHNGEDRRPARNRQRRDNAPERSNPARRCRDHNNLHHAALTPLRPTMFPCRLLPSRVERHVSVSGSSPYNRPTSALCPRPILNVTIANIEHTASDSHKVPDDHNGEKIDSGVVPGEPLSRFPASDIKSETDFFAIVKT